MIFDFLFFSGSFATASRGGQSPPNGRLCFHRQPSYSTTSKTRRDRTCISIRIYAEKDRKDRKIIKTTPQQQPS
jgi:hypothetical protein